MTAPVRVGVLVSGAGTNLGALLDAEARGELAPATIALVASNRPGAAALERARAAGRAALVIDHRAYADRPAFEAALAAALRAAEVELVALAGFMRVLGPAFLRAFPHRVVNVHPALLPAFPGIDAVGQALAHGVKVTGCTVHLVDEGVDTGPILLQEPVELRDDDDAAALHARIRAVEHRLLPRAVRALAQGRVQVEGRRARIR